MPSRVLVAPVRRAAADRLHGDVDLHGGEGTAGHTHEGPLGYGVGHADVIFAFDIQDRPPVLYPGGVRPSDIADHTAPARPAPGRHPVTTRLATGLIALATAASVSACGASLDAQTYQQRDNAESSNASAGALALRNVAVEAPSGDEGYEVGEDATVVLTVTNASAEADTLVEVTSSAAEEVAVIAGGTERDMVVPALGSTGSAVTLELRGLTRPLRPGEYVDLTFRFADNGTTEVLTPVITTGETDRPVYTGEYLEGGEEPALQAPTGGDSEESAGEGEGSEASG